MEKNKRRILMLAPTPFFSDRGCHIRILNSYLKLERNGFEIDLLTYPLGRNVLDIKTIRVMKMHGYKKVSPGFSIYKPFLDLLMYFKARREMNLKNYEFIYAHLHEGALIGYFLKRKFKKRLVFNSQGSLTGELSSQKTIKKNSIFYKLMWKLEKFITEKSDEIITSTDGLKYFILQNFKVKDIKVEKDLPDKSLFNINAKKANFNLPSGKKIVVYLGGMQLYKGIDFLLRAIPHVKKDYHFLLMGHPNSNAKKMAEELNILDRIIFTGKIKYEEAPKYLKLGNIAVSPKTLESGEANAKIYNYLAMCLPIVCFDMPETRQIKKEFPKAKFYFAKQKNIKDLAKKIEECLI